MNNNLVPTPIVNKNGVATTVHKRSPDHQSAASKMPAPSLTQKPQNTTPALTTEQRDEMINHFVDLSNQGSPLIFEDEDQKLRDGLDNYSDSILLQLLQHTLKDDTSKGTFLLAKENKSEEYLRTYLALHGDHYSQIFEPGRGYSFNLPDAVDSLATYEQLPYEDTDDYYQKATALTGVVAAIQYKIPYESHGSEANAQFITYTPSPTEPSSWTARLSNNYLVDFILEQPEEWESIADIITTRKTQDPDFIQFLLNSAPSSIREGLL